MAPFQDAFTRANNADLGTNWTPVTGLAAFSISSNTALENNSSDSAEYVNSVTPTNDQYAQAVLVGSMENVDPDFGIGVAVRISTSAATMYFALANNVAAPPAPGEIRLGKMVAGTPTFLASYDAGSSPVAGDTIRLEVQTNGSNADLRVYHNGTLRISHTDTTSVIASGRYGVIGRVFNTIPALDTFEGDDLIPAGTVLPGAGELVVAGYAPSADPSNPQPPDTTVQIYVFAVAGTAEDILLRDPSGPAAAAGAALVEVPVGALALTGPVPEFLTTGLQRITPPVGTIRLGRPHTADTGMITADSGDVTADIGAPQGAPTVIVSNAAPGRGQLVVTGFAPTVSAGSSQVATPGVGVLVALGFAALVVVSNHQIVTPGVGALTLTGQAPTRLIGTNIGTGVGQLTLTGFAPIASVGIRVNPGVGVLSLAGFTPSMPKWTATGALTMAGFNPTPNIGVNVGTGVGALTVTGFAPTALVSDNKSVSPGVGVLALAGLAPNVITPRTVTPGVGVLALAGLAPAATQNIVKAPSVGVLVLAGLAPNTLAPTVVTPGVGALVMAGLAPSMGTKGSGMETTSSTTERVTRTSNAAGDANTSVGDRVTRIIPVG